MGRLHLCGGKRILAIRREAKIMPREENYPFLLWQSAHHGGESWPRPAAKGNRGLRKARHPPPFCPSRKSYGWNRAADKENCFVPAVEGPSGAEKRSHGEVTEFTGCGKIFLSLIWSN
jgi:hypothetical protein